MRLLDFHAKLEVMFLENDEECHVSEVKNQDTELKISLWSKKQLSFIQESLIFIERFSFATYAFQPALAGDAE